MHSEITEKGQATDYQVTLNYHIMTDLRNSGTQQVRVEYPSYEKIIL